MIAQNHQDTEYLVERDRALQARCVVRLTTALLFGAYLVAIMTVFA